MKGVGWTNADYLCLKSYTLSEHRGVVVEKLYLRKHIGAKAYPVRTALPPGVFDGESLG